MDSRSVAKPPSVSLPLRSSDGTLLAADDVAHYSQLSLRARGDACARLAARLGLAALPAPNRVATTSVSDCLGLGPDEWLLVAARGADRSFRDQLSATTGTDGAVIDVSASRVPLRVAGPSARDVLASCCPLDLHPRRFGPGHCAQSLVAKAPVVLQQLDDVPAYRVLVRPSLVDFVVRWLADGLSGLDT